MAFNILIATATARAVEAIILPLSNDAINLSVIGERYESQDPNLQIKIFGTRDGGNEELVVSALGKRAPYRWLSFSLVNSTGSVIKPLIVVPQRGFVGTGLIWPIIGGNTVISIIASSGVKPEPVLGRPGVYRLSVEPKQTITYVVEISGNWPPRLGLWNERAYEFYVENRALFRGLLLGAAGLISLYLTVLFVVSRQAVYLSGALLSVAGTALLLSEFGYLSGTLFAAPGMAVKIRSAIEALMALGLFSFFHTFLLLRHRLPFLGYMNLVLLIGLTALVPYAFYQPYYAAGLARISFAGGVGFGSLIILYLIYCRNPRALAVLPAWITLGGWTFFTGSAIEGGINHPLLSPAIASGLVLVLLLVAFVITQFAFGKRMMGEATGRNALALAGAGHSVWDYNLEQKSFFISPEIEKLLGLRPGHFQLGGTHTWLDLMHKEDRANYTNKLEATVKDGKGRLNLSFRMRGADGKYRWLQLRARAMPGESKRASRCIGILADITHAKLAEERLLRDAVHDYLTGLPNQALFSDRLERSTKRYDREDGYQLGLILIDIDRFNNINDSLGHAAGDSFLLISARRIQQHLSASDTIARVSENRFAVLIASQTQSEKIREITEKIQKSISEPIPFKPEDIYLTTNIGMAVYKPDTDDAVEFSKKAEIAMYSAKRHGRNNLSVFDPRMARRSTNRIALESDLRRAIEKSEFVLMYQPIVRLETGKIAGFEALVRWQHKDRGLLGPDEFMDIAEETGLIVDIGRFVLNQAGMQLGIWQRLFTFIEPLFMSVNVSTRQILQPDLIDDLHSILDRAEIKTGTLKIEVTETQVMENPELSSRVLKRIRKSGAGLSLDDFGTGYSSLSYLQSFPFDTIKIDKSFVHKENGDPASDIILKSVVSLAHDLGMNVVAEGAEEVEEAAQLREMGCEFVQGYLFGEPMSAKDAHNILSHKPLPSEEPAQETIFDKLAKLKPQTKQPQTEGSVKTELEAEKPASSASPAQQREETVAEKPAAKETVIEQPVAEETVAPEPAAEKQDDSETGPDIKPEPVAPDEEPPEDHPPQHDAEDAARKTAALMTEKQAQQETGVTEKIQKTEKTEKTEKIQKTGQPGKTQEIQETQARQSQTVEKSDVASTQKRKQATRHRTVTTKSAKTRADNKAKKTGSRKKISRKKKMQRRPVKKKS